MNTSTDERQTLEVTGSHFVHDVFVFVRGVAPAARCMTARPDAQCECGLYALRWVNEREMR